jgi:hypothetical protein
VHFYFQKSVKLNLSLTNHEKRVIKPGTPVVFDEKSEDLIMLFALSFPTSDVKREKQSSFASEKLEKSLLRIEKP